MKFVAVVITTSLIAFACSSNPSREDAEEWMKRHGSTIETIDAFLRQAVAALPRFATAPPDCSQKKGIPAQNLCSRAKGDWFTKVGQADKVFASETLLGLLDKHHALAGVDIRYRKTADGPDLSLGSVGSSDGPNMKGLVEPKDGLTAGERRVGWGRGQTSIQFGSTGEKYGSGDPVPMLHVTWQFSVEGAQVSVAITLLAEGETTERWRQGWRKHRVGTKR